MLFFAAVTCTEGSGEGQECKKSIRGRDFRGTSFTSTKNYRVCQRWDSDSPHVHTKNEVAAQMEILGLEGLKSHVTLQFLPQYILP